MVNVSKISLFRLKIGWLSIVHISKHSRFSRRRHYQNHGRFSIVHWVCVVCVCVCACACVCACVLCGVVLFCVVRRFESAHGRGFPPSLLSSSALCLLSSIFSLFFISSLHFSSINTFLFLSTKLVLAGRLRSPRGLLPGGSPFFLRNNAHS